VARDVEFNLTASDKTGPALSKAEQAFVRSQRRIKETADKAADGIYGSNLVKAVGRIAPKITGALVGAVGQAASSSGPLLAGVGVAAAPIIAGTIGAAIIGGAGIGGVLGGVALAARDPRVKAAGAELGKNMLSDLEDFAKPFIAPVLQGVDLIDSRFQETGATLRSIFANASRYVLPLTDGATRFLQGIARGADALIANAGPVINALSDGLAELGRDTEEFLTEISQGSDGAAAAVRQLVDLVGGFLAVLGPVVNGVNQVSGALERWNIQPGILQLIGALGDASDETGTFTRQTAGATTAIAGQGQAASIASQDLTALEAAIRGNVSANVSLYGAATSAKQAIVDATEAIRSNGEGLSLNSEKGRENRATLQRLATALNAQYDAHVKVNGAGAAADQVLRSNRESFIAVASAASGSAAKARQLANDLLGIPDERKPKVTLLDNASGKIDNVINRLAAVKSKTVTLTIAVRQSGDAAALRKQSLPSGLSASSHFAQTTGEGRYRTGGPTPVNVQSNVQVALDGKPFYDYTDRAIMADRSRAAWRQKVGTV
jgi:hypothetical protein